MNTLTRLVTFHEVAQQLAVRLELVQQLIHDKALRTVRIGTERRVRPEDLTALIDAAEE